MPGSEVIVVVVVLVDAVRDEAEEATIIPVLEGVGTALVLMTLVVILSIDIDATKADDVSTEVQVEVILIVKLDVIPLLLTLMLT